MKRRKPFVQSAEDEKNFVPLTDTEGSAFLTFYRSLPKKPSDTVRFFFKKDFYVCYEEDAELIADDFYNSRTVIKTFEVAKKSTATPTKASKLVGPSYINLSQPLTETIIKALIHEKRFKVEIYSLGDDRKWFLYRRGSPGNHQELEDLLYSKSEMNESPIMMSVVVSMEGNQRVVGAAFCDNLLKKLFVSEFLDNEQLTNLESLIVQISAKECYTMPFDMKDKTSAKLAEILERCEVVVSVRKKQEFDSKSIEQDLRNLLGKHYIDAHNDLELKNGMCATAALISGLELLSSEGNLGAFRLKRYDLKQFMRLDSSAVQALNLVPNPREGNQQYNLFGILNRCKTAMGSRKLMQWIKQPLISIESINTRHDMVEIFINDTSMLNDIRNTGLRGISDIERISKKIQRDKANLQDCVILYAFTQKLPKIVQLLQNYCSDVNRKLLEELFIERLNSIIEKFNGYVALVEQLIDLSAIDEGEYQINPDWDPTLKDLETQKSQIKGAMKKREYEVKKYLNSPDHFALEYDKVYGWVYRLTKKEEKVLDTKENKAKFTIVANVKSGIKFQDKTLKQHSEEYTEIVNTYTENCKEIIAKVMQVVKGYLPTFEEAQEIVSDLDVFASFADVAHSAVCPYTRPQMYPLGEGNTVLLQSRHPVLEATPDMKFVPNDCHLERGSSSFIIITGPNMGGKSTFIRQVGVIVLMAQIGCFIPCDAGSSVSVADAILCRVGAGDSQLRGVSTFMAEMIETATILKTSTKNSLVIIDELGRGTSTYDGFGLAWAISEHICTKIGAFCLFATHFHELTQLSEEIPCVKNRHVSAVVSDENGLILQYNVVDGPSDQSFGIHVAKIARFPDSVLKVATEKAAELENFDTKTKAIIHNSKNGAQTSSDEEQLAEEFISSVLSKFSDLPIDQMEPERLQQALSSLKTQIESSNLPMVQQLLQAELS